MSEPLEADLRRANESFYRAFRERDIAAMDRVWAEQVPISCMHPGMPVISGRDAVMRSWRGILGHPGAPTLHCSGVRVHLLGTSAYVTCLEGQPNVPPRLIATNVFTMEAGFWRLVHHQAGPLSPASAQRAAEPEPDEAPSVDPYDLN